MKDEIVLMKLSNGLDAIGKVVDLDAETITFSKLRLLQYQPMGNETRIGFAMFLIAADDLNLWVDRRHIITWLIAPSKIAEGYRQATSPIQLANTIPNDMRGRVIEVKPN